MKLVEILAKELDVWLEDVVVMTQDADDAVYGWNGTPAWDSVYNGEWLANEDADIVHSVTYYELATDYRTATVTREMWEAERNSDPESWQQGDKLTVIDSVYDTHGVNTGDVVEFCRHDTNRGKSAPECYHKMLGRVWIQLENLKFSHRAIAPAQQDQTEMTPIVDVKESNGGWIKWDGWDGGKCPVEDGSDVSVKFDAGDIARDNNPESWRWYNLHSGRNIIAYRLHKPAQQDKEEMINPVMEVSGQQSTPYTHRDTIIHCQAIIEDCQRDIAKHTEALAKEGFELIGRAPGEDMSDWRNWKVGDVITCLDSTGHLCSKYKDGNEYTICGAHGEKIRLRDDDGDIQIILAGRESAFKWHSRP